MGRGGRERELPRGSGGDERITRAGRALTLVRRQLRRFALYRTLFPVRWRIQPGNKRFLRAATASVFFVRRDLLLRGGEGRAGGRAARAGGRGHRACK